MAKDIERVRQMIRGGDLSQETLNKLAEEVPDNAEEISTKVENMLKDAPEEMDTFKEVSDALSTMGGSGGGMEPIALALAAKDIITYDQFEAMTGKSMQDLNITWDKYRATGDDAYYNYGYSGTTNEITVETSPVDGVVTLPQFAIKGQDDSTIYRIRSMCGYKDTNNDVTKVIVPYGYKALCDRSEWNWFISSFWQEQRPVEIVLPDSLEELHASVNCRIKNCYISDSLKTFTGDVTLIPIPNANGSVSISLPGGVSLAYTSFWLNSGITTANIYFRGIPKRIDGDPEYPGEGAFHLQGAGNLTINVYVPWREGDEYSSQFDDAILSHNSSVSYITVNIHYGYIA